MGEITMKRSLCILLTLAFLLSLTACGGEPEITGIWEQEMEISVLGEGVEEPTAAASLLRFNFREDGTGLQQHIMPDDSYPDAVREFSWSLEGDTLTLEYAEGHAEEFSVVLTKTSLKLENPRGSYDLTKAE